MPQNIYDNPEFFAGYNKLRTEGTGLNDVLEQPALHRLLPSSLQGLRVLDLGCGFGNFARLARQLGARQVLGIDVSERMLDLARQRTDDPAIVYRQLSIEELQRDGEPFDLVVSSLALHYVQDYDLAVQHVFALLKPGGRFAFSVEHPMSTALPEQQWYLAPDGTRLHWPVDRYQEEGARHTRWFVDGVIKYHRTIAHYVNGLLDAGFQLARLEEPGPLATALEADPSLAQQNRRPPFLLLAADRPL